ncbi:hypothetical protein ACSSUR_13755 [Pseudomonas cedrina]|uniref:hypothetical protein n=1 Tax=Pseudomonas cedrina TaxID=651740 RepID=UPI003EDB3A33
MERYKFLYELSRKALDEELDRYKKLDEKASRFLSILSIGIVAYTALLNAGASKIFPLHCSGAAEWVFVILAVLTFIALLSAWLRIFYSIKLAKSPRLAIDANTNLMAEEEELISMYYALALSCQTAQVTARKILEEKTGFLESAYKEIQFSTYLLGASVGSYFWIAATTTGK